MAQIRATLFVVLLVHWIAAQSDRAGQDAAAFNAAYAAYLEAEKQNDRLAMLTHSKQAYELGRRVFPPENKSLPALTYNYGRALSLNHKESEAEPILKESLTQFQTLYGERAIELVDPLMELGRVQGSLLKGAQRGGYYDLALRIVGELEGKDSVRYAEIALEAGVGLMHLSQSEYARSYVERAYKTFNEKLGPTDLRTGQAALWMGKYEMAVGKFWLAEKHFQTALAIFEQLTEPSNSFELTTHAFLVNLYEEEGKRDLATKHCLAIGNMTPAMPNQKYQPVYRPVPDYPHQDRMARNEGSIIVKLVVDESGFVKDPVVMEANASRSLQDAAVAAAAKARYAPRFVNGAPVTTPDVMIKYTFNLWD